VTNYVALLRGINVGANKRVAMSDLRDALGALGMREPRSLLNSGNLVFGAEANATALETLLEREFAKRLGLQTKVFVRSARDWKRAIAANPFIDEAKDDPSHLIVMFLKAKPAARTFAALGKAITGPERILPGGTQAYITYPDGIAGSRLTNALIDAKLGTPGTGRNWNTVLKLNALLGG